MAHIYVFSPSGAVRDRCAFRRGIRRLQALGHEVEIDPSALQTWQRFAGDDAQRIDTMKRVAHSHADIALCTRGGYGLTRILSGLPLDALSHAISRHGLRLVGMSDFTALQLALLAHSADNVTWAGSSLMADWGQPEEVDDIMQACFEDMAQGISEGTGWYTNKRDEPDAQLVLLDEPLQDAVLWGGNLSVLTSLLGTPYCPNIQGGVLFLEDVGEHPYRIERMLTQLLHAGVLDAQRAIVLGQFSAYKLTAHDKGFTMRSVMAWLRSMTRTPVLTGLAHGHVPTKVLLPVGQRVELHASTRERLLLWGHMAHHAQHHDCCTTHANCMGHHACKPTDNK